MGSVTIQEFTTLEPIYLIGLEAGVCWGADITDDAKNYRRGIDCLESGHGRTFEFPDVYMTLDGYSAKVIREFYTHLGGAPTRLQASTRYLDYEHGFGYIIPASVGERATTEHVYERAMGDIRRAMEELDRCGVPREDSSMLLPLGMATKMVGKYNLRTLIDMSHQRMCGRAFWEFRELFGDIRQALADYSEQWAYITERYFVPKCDYLGYCPERDSCGRMPQKK